MSVSLPLSNIGQRSGRQNQQVEVSNEPISQVSRQEEIIIEEEEMEMYEAMLRQAEQGGEQQVGDIVERTNEMRIENDYPEIEGIEEEYYGDYDA